MSRLFFGGGKWFIVISFTKELASRVANVCWHAFNEVTSVYSKPFFRFYVLVRQNNISKEKFYRRSAEVQSVRWLYCQLNSLDMIISYWRGFSHKRNLWQTCAISVILLHSTVNHWRADVSSNPLPWSSINVHDYICRKGRNWPVFCLRIDLNQILQVLPVLNLCLFVIRVGDHTTDISHQKIWKIQAAHNRKKKIN